VRPRRSRPGLPRRGKFQAVKLFGLTFAQSAAEAFDAVVGTDKSMCIHQVLVDRRVVRLARNWASMNARWGSQVELLMGLSRWPGWGNLIGCAVATRGICLEFLYAFGIGADGLSVNSCDTFNLAVAGVGLQQCCDGCL